MGNGFITKLDYSNNRQIKQRERTNTVLSGASVFGVKFSELTNGPDPNNSGTSESLTSIYGTFSGNTGTTIFSFSDSRLNLVNSALSAITPSNSATTQTTGNVFIGNTSTIIDENTVYLDYTGVSLTLNVTGMTDTGGGTYTGQTSSINVSILSAGTLDYTGRTIWAYVPGILSADTAYVNRLNISNTCCTGSALTTLGLDANGFVVSGISSASTGSFVNITGDTMTGGLVTPSLSASTISGTTFLSGGTNLMDIFSSLDTFVTGGTLVGSIVTFTNNLGGTFTVDLSDLISGTSKSTTISVWTATGDTYYADFTHGLGTKDLVVEGYDTTNNLVIGFDDIEFVTDDLVRLYVTNNTLNLRVTVIGGEVNGDNYVNINGDTMTGTLYGPSISATTISATTFYGNGSGLTGITASGISHNSLNGLNGSSDYYHLSAAEYNAISGNNLTNNFVNTSGDTMTGTLILPTLSATTISATTFYGSASGLTGVIASGISHNSLSGLQGGTSGQYFHLTAAEYNSISGNNLTNNFVNTSGDTMTGTLYSPSISATTISATTFYVNGIGLTGITANTPTLSFGASIDTPTSSDKIVLWRTDVNITFQEIISVYSSSGAGVTFRLVHGSDVSASGTNLTNSQTSTSYTTGNTLTINDATVPANSWIWFSSSAASGTSVFFTINARYTED